jgi:Skp family chaperone for outer membrane proteins
MKMVENRINERIDMKSKAIIFGGWSSGCWAGGYQQDGWSGQGGHAPAKVGVVSIDAILKSSKKHEAWKKVMDADEQKIRAEFDKAKSELDLLQADMKTRTKGGDDFQRLNREYAEKEAMLKAKDSYYQQEMTQKVQDWTEKLYQDIQKKVSDTAKKNGLDMVIGREDPDFPSVSMQDLLLTIRTNKVLYYAESLDITAGSWRRWMPGTDGRIAAWTRRRRRHPRWCGGRSGRSPSARGTRGWRRECDGGSTCADWRIPGPGYYFVLERHIGLLDKQRPTAVICGREIPGTPSMR